MTSARHYAEVIGDPVTHSKSPQIHRFWLAHLAIAGDYRAARIERGQVGAYLDLRADDPAWRGCNVTMPLKKEALLAAGRRCSARAAQVGAANILLPAPGGIRADNSDVVAVERLLAPLFARNDTVVVHLVGTGGAAAAAAAAVLQLRPETSVFTYGRDEARALAFREAAGLDPSPLFFHRLGETPPWGSASDIVINATPLGMRGHPALPMALDEMGTGATVFDMVYDPLETNLLHDARRLGLNRIDGLAMLIEQAAFSFDLFFGAVAPRDQDARLREVLAA